MTRARGHNLQRATAAYLTRWWPNAESTPNGRAGRDVLGTPGVWWEVKTSLKGTSPTAIVDKTYDDADGELPVAVYWPPGTGAANPERAIAMQPLITLALIVPTT